MDAGEDDGVLISPDRLHCRVFNSLGNGNVLIGESVVSLGHLTHRVPEQRVLELTPVGQLQVTLEAQDFGHPGPRRSIAVGGVPGSVVHEQVLWGGRATGGLCVWGTPDPSRFDPASRPLLCGAPCPPPPLSAYCVPEPGSCPIPLAGSCLREHETFFSQ